RGVDAIHLADHAGGSKSGDQRQVVSHPFVLQSDDGREFGRFAGEKPPAQPRAPLLEQTEERAALPVLGRLALAGRTVLDQLGLALVTLAPPADNAGLHAPDARYR